MRLIPETQKIEAIGNFQNLGCKTRWPLSETLFEIGDCRALLPRRR
jgi:hypothetical protein